MLRRAALAAYRSQRSQAALVACPSCSARQLFTEPNISGDCSRIQHPFNRFTSLRGYAKPAEVDDDDDDEDPPIPVNPRVEKLAEEIMHLNLLEVADLTDILQKRLGFSAPSFGSLPTTGGPMPGTAAPAAAEAAPAEPAKEPEKTEFDVKLEGFDSASKIKVIKEIRVVTELGLKEAKELVEKSPVVIKSGLKKEEAEELKTKLEAVGGKVTLE